MLHLRLKRPPAVHIDHSRTELYNDNTFTFRVGPSKTPFVVHATIISRHSKVLSRLITGPFKESIEKVADLPEVEPEIFRHFLSYAYFMSNDAVVKGPINQRPNSMRTSISRMMELLLAGGHTKFNCKKCLDEEPLKFSFSFPLCSRCGEEGMPEFPPSWNEICVSSDCQKEADFSLGICCLQCLADCTSAVEQLEREVWESDVSDKLLLNPHHRLEELQGFHFDIPLRAKEIVEAAQTLPGMAYPVSALESTTLLDTVNLVIFANIYDVQPLWQLSLMSFYQKLTQLQERLDKHSVSAVIQLVEVVYKTTMNSGADSDLEDKHVLRRMISKFIAAHCRTFVSSPDFVALLSQGGELAGDVLQTLIFLNEKLD